LFDGIVMWLSSALVCESEFLSVLGYVSDALFFFSLGESMFP